MKFNSGDIVRVNNPDSIYHNLLGEVIEIDNTTGIYIINTKINRIGVHEKYLTPVK